jgi:hydroxymethylglutaryl-CoA synthase
VVLTAVSATAHTLRPMRGILGAAGYVPYWRLDRGEIAATFGSGGGKGTRAVASYDEDTTTMGVEAARLALRGAGGVEPHAIMFSTVAPAYLDKTNATTIHAALRLDTSVAAFDFGGALRSGVGALRAALHPGGPVLLVSSDLRDGLPTSADESAGGDGAAALLIGSDDDGPVIAELLGAASTTEEFIDRWRLPGDRRSKSWEERFGETKYVPLGEEAFAAGLKAAELSADRVDRLVVTGPHARAIRSLTPRLGVDAAKVVDDLSARVGWTGAAHPALLLASALEHAEPGQVIVLLSVADGADALVFRTTDAIHTWKPARTVAAQIESAGTVHYGKFLAWRGEVTLEGPRRPEPGRISASISGRREAWKYGFVGSKDRSTGAVHLPPARVSMKGGAVDDMEPAPMSDERGTISAFTIDRIAYSPSPPIVFAVVDFDGGGRAPVELCDVDAGSLQVGDRVEMTFRRLFTADGIHNYFWKARPIRDA